MNFKCAQSIFNKTVILYTVLTENKEWIIRLFQLFKFLSRYKTVMYVYKFHALTSSRSKSTEISLQLRTLAADGIKACQAIFRVPHNECSIRFGAQADSQEAR